ncbi:hypothetical protein [Salinarimonas ramus]|uniref:Uncharacterized protein n=1 Tax=Salinarimonas ramus TaxID=690164 RepID=A0A917QC37_9HYPH|nr:hypothetical protein [Salinarimonas ramus]GGK42133.1 hypothetical protein GCM10011322_31550 [Salinarimonas ramus]
MEHVVSLFRIFFLFGAVLSFALMLIEAVGGDAASAALLGASFAANVIFFYIGDIEQFKIFGTVEAKLNRAKDLLSDSQRISRAFASLMIEQLAWGGRWGGLDTRRKKEIVWELSKLLKDSGLSDAEVQVLRKDLVDTAAIDLLSTWHHVVVRATDVYKNSLDSDDDEGRRSVDSWRKSIQIDFTDLPFDEALLLLSPDSVINHPGIKGRIDFARRRIKVAYESCKSEMNYSDEYVKIMEEQVNGGSISWANDLLKDFRS